MTPPPKNPQKNRTKAAAGTTATTLSHGGFDASRGGRLVPSGRVPPLVRGYGRQAALPLVRLQGVLFLYATLCTAVATTAALPAAAA